MDERTQGNDERPERTQPSQPVHPWTEPEATAPLPPSDTTAPLPLSESTAPLPLSESTAPASPVETTPSPEIATAMGAAEPAAHAGEPSEQLVSNEQPWVVPSWEPPSWEPNWSQGGQWAPVQPHGSGPYPPGSYPPESSPPAGYPTGEYGAGGYGPGGYGPGGYGTGGYGARDDQPAGPQRPRRGRRAAALAAAALVLLGAGAGAGVAYAFRPTQGSPSALASSPAGKSLTTSQIAATVDPAVVDVTTNLGEGTGIIATSKGEIITNNHVVEGATSIRVAILNHGTYTATVVGTDAKADVAVLQLSGVSGLPTVRFGNSSAIKVGNTVVAIGNAGGLNQLPLPATSGAITALGRTITASDPSGASETLTGMIQMNAQIQPGNSGGPLVDSSGEVIGMNTAAANTDNASSAVIGFAIPIDRVLQVANDIEQGKSGNGIVIGSVAFLGIAGVTVPLQGSSQSSGAGLEYVVPGGPADKAGIQQGDVIVAFNGHATTTMQILAGLIHQLRPGDNATVTFLNTATGGKQTVTVTLGTGPPA